ncbi:MAG TPA: hypothetical protein VGS79_25225 [Puia sp.]|nr:hypothetical protein [Puia sp.]
MIAHNPRSLDNRDIWQQAAGALDNGVIAGEEYHRIREAYPFELYAPNVFIRIGLFLLTALAVACGVGLSELIAGWNNGLLILWSLICYCSLELFIRRKRIYRAGIDDALLWMATLLLFYGVILLIPRVPDNLSSGLILLLATWGMLRYADRVMALVAYCALMKLIFHFLVMHGPFGSAVIPIVFMAVSIVAYLLFTRLPARESLRHYRTCLLLLTVAALLSFYLSVNYYVVQHIDPSMRVRDESAPVALGWLWWAFTGIVPVAYIGQGIRRKDAILLWTGLVLTACTVFTIRYYYHVLPAEVAMIIAGCILVIGAYAFTRYLRIPRNGFTSDAPDEPHLLQKLPVESLIMAETFKSVPSQPSDQSGRFGGGSGGGAGAGGTY